MNRTKYLIALAVIILAVIAFSLFTLRTKPTTLAKPQVAATIFPIADIAENVAGGKFQVITILPPGGSPHTFELTAEQAKEMQGTKIIFSIAYGMDDWILNVQDVLQDAKIVDVSEGVSLIKSEELHDDQEEALDREQGDADPHYWLSVQNAKIITDNIAQELATLDPDNGDYYEANAKAYKAELDKLDADIRTTLSGIKTNKIMTMHEAWSYFAKDYGLEVVATFEPFPGREPTPKYLAGISDTAKENNLDVLFSEPQLSQQILEPFLQDLGMHLAVLDPVGGLEDRDSYINMMRYNANTIHEELK